MATDAERDRAFELFSAYRKAHNAWSSYKERIMHENWEAYRCAKSGKPILGSDEVLEDLETHELFIRSEIGIPRAAATGKEEAA